MFPKSFLATLIYNKVTREKNGWEISVFQNAHSETEYTQLEHYGLNSY